MGCFVRVARIIRVEQTDEELDASRCYLSRDKDSPKNFMMLLLAGCVGAPSTVPVTGSWVSDSFLTSHASDGDEQTAEKEIRHEGGDVSSQLFVSIEGGEIKDRGRTERSSDCREIKVLEPCLPPRIQDTSATVMVLSATEVRALVGPHFDAPVKEDGQVVNQYCCRMVLGAVSTASGAETYALLPDGSWLPCRFPGSNGNLVVTVPEEPLFVSALFYGTILRDCPVYRAPCLELPSLEAEVLPAGMSLSFCARVWYSSSHLSTVVIQNPNGYGFVQLSSIVGDNDASRWIFCDPSFVEFHSQ